MYFFAQVETHPVDVEQTHVGEAEHTSAEGHATHEQGLFDNNFINWLLLLAFLVGCVPRICLRFFNSRRQQIESEIEAAKASKEEGERFLEEQRKEGRQYRGPKPSKCLRTPRLRLNSVLL